jgi:hypothetical protein
MTTVKLWTINEIQAANRNAGYHWFDPSTMRFFGTRIFPEVYQGPGGIYFVTSDKAGPHENSGRDYNVREFKPETSQTGTAEGGRGHKTKSAAVKDARTRAIGRALPKSQVHEADGGIPFELRGLKVTSEEHKPVTELDQFTFDLVKHGKCSQESAEHSAHWLRKLAKQHHKYMEDYCNIPDSGLFDENGDPTPKLARVRDQIISVATQCNATGVVFSGDPRGVTVKLTFADGFTNDYAKEGYCVPTE